MDEDQGAQETRERKQMIHHSIHLDKTPSQRIGIQKSNNQYTYLHWKDDGYSDKFKYISYNAKLDPKRYKPIGPTILVEWQE